MECMLVAQSCPTLCDAMECSPPGSSVHGILQTSILEGASISSSMGSSWPRDQTQVSLLQPNTSPSEPPKKPYIWEGVRLMPSFRTIITVWGENGIPGKKILLLSIQFSSVQQLIRVWLFATPWIAARQASLSITNSRSSLKLTSIESVMPSSHLILCCHLLLLPTSLPASEYFPMSQLFHGEGKVYPLQYSGLEDSVNYPWNHKQSNTTEQLSLALSLPYF